MSDPRTHKRYSFALRRMESLPATVDTGVKEILAMAKKLPASKRRLNILLCLETDINLAIANYKRGLSEFSKKVQKAAN